LLALLAGCHPHRRPALLDLSRARALASVDDSCRDRDGAARPMFLPEPGAEPAPLRPPRHVLALSGGGAYGAYAAGFLSGWSCSGTRPEFDVVTGISTGALIAPFAFLGPAYDAHAGHLYTHIEAPDIFRVRAWIAIPFAISVASSAPLRELIQSQVTPELLARVAAEHRKGRRLYVGTTNLDTRRLVVWDLGAIACRPGPEGCELFRDVLLASCSIPGILPPVRFELESGGKRVTELHADGGVAAPLFVPSAVFAAAARLSAEEAAKALPGGPAPPPTNLYVVVSGKLYPSSGPIRRHRVIPVLGATTEGLLYAHCRAECANLYGLALGAGMKYHLTSLRQEFETVPMPVNFDQRAMEKLYREGMRQGSAGPAWEDGPPALSPGDGESIRTGPRLPAPPTQPGPTPAAPGGS
jgi:hypothetical protein